MSINAINGVNNAQYGMIQADPIKPETREKLKALGIDEKSVRNETQAQNKINEKEEMMRKEIQERIQAQASGDSQAAQAGSQNQQPQQVQGVEKADEVEGVSQSQQIQQPQGIEQQHAIHNQQQGNEHVKAFAGANASQAQQGQAFLQGQELVAMYNKFKLGLV
ncbi:MAG: hypothetical protein K6E29_06735 [Cyanobacteria bacterium RUI128]|nr:hypothetical protein [Cyanobacteria bacterium RUI128]